VTKLAPRFTSNHPRIRLREIQNFEKEGGRVVRTPSSPPQSPSKQRFHQFYKVFNCKEMYEQVLVVGRIIVTDWE